jgi:hypothetical protein
MAIVLLFAMFHYIAGYRLMYSLGILYAKQDAKECMTKKNNIQKLTFSATGFSSLNWSEENKEFSFNNEMYDVSNIQKTGDKYIVTVYSDDFETEFVTAFHSFEKELFHPDQSSKGAKSAEDVMSAFQKDFTPASQFNMQNATSLTNIKPSVDRCKGGNSLQAPDNIWHPPLQS